MKAQEVESDPSLILNWGCGKGGHVERAINLDSNATSEPDFIESMTAPWDWEDDSVEEIWFHHVMEHISKDLHFNVFLEANRVLKQGGRLFIGFPDFEKCAMNYIENKNGKRAFWEATIYGLQRYEGDFHVCAITPRYLRSKLHDCGFGNMKFDVDELSDCYGICLSEKVLKSRSYEEVQKLQWQS